MKSTPTSLPSKIAVHNKATIDRLKIWLRAFPLDLEKDEEEHSEQTIQEVQTWLQNIPAEWRINAVNELKIKHLKLEFEDTGDGIRLDPVIFVKQEEEKEETVMIQGEEQTAPPRDPLETANQTTVEVIRAEECPNIKEESIDPNSNPGPIVIVHQEVESVGFDYDLKPSMISSFSSALADKTSSYPPSQKPARSGKSTLRAVKRGRCSEDCPACNTDACLQCNACLKRQKCELRVCKNLVSLKPAVRDCPACGKPQTNLTRHIQKFCPATKETSSSNSKGGAYNLVYICNQDDERCYTREEMDAHLALRHPWGATATNVFSTRFACGAPACNFMGEERKEMVNHNRTQHPERVLKRRKKIRKRVSQLDFVGDESLSKKEDPCH